MSESATAAPPDSATVALANNADAKAATVEDGKTPSDTSKLKTFVMILKRFIGVTDIAAVRLSLPAQLLEPIPNLEYWHYCDRPERFAAIGDSDDDLERMLNCLRFWFTKDLKYAKGRPCKPYNSSLGEFFRCSWDADEVTTSSSTSDGGDNASAKPVRITYITEQTSHHPPVSAYSYECPEKGIVARGYDQVSAKFTGTSIRVVPGKSNKGIFLTLQKRDNEEYHFSHPAAYLSGFLRGTLYVYVADIATIACRKTGLKTLTHYIEDGYFGRSQNRVEGVIYRPADFDADAPTRIKDIPRDTILARYEGVWTDKVYLTLGNTDFKKVPAEQRQVLTDVNPLSPLPKRCPPLEQQLPNESRRFWAGVTESILAKQFSQATSRKTALEERQRERAAEREKQGKDWLPRFFTTVTEADGRPVLSPDGRAAMESLISENYALPPAQEYGAL